MFGIKDVNLFFLSDSSKCFAGERESFLKIQLGRIVSRPLTTSLTKRRSVFSWKGRYVCFFKFCQTLVSEPYRFIKNIVVIGILFLVTFLTIIKRRPFVEGIIATSSSIGGLCVRPLVFILDLIKLSAGALIEPKIGIALLI